METMNKFRTKPIHLVKEGEIFRLGRYGDDRLCTAVEDGYLLCQRAGCPHDLTLYFAQYSDVFMID
jgi:hypothetical protein